MNRQILSLLVAAVVAAIAPAVVGRAFGVDSLWASTTGIVLALLVAYPVIRAKRRVTFAQWAAVVTVVAIVAVTAQLLIR